MINQTERKGCPSLCGRARLTKHIHGTKYKTKQRKSNTKQVKTRQKRQNKAK